jgi:hypothetical protein
MKMKRIVISNPVKDSDIERAGGKEENPTPYTLHPTPDSKSLPGK